MKKIALLGATGYVGRSLLREFFIDDTKTYHLFLFSRSKEKLYTHIPEIPKKIGYSIHSLDEWNKETYDVIINCTGVSSNPNSQKNPYELFKVAEEIDTLIIDYIHKHPRCIYINISSGVVYGDNFEKSVNEKTNTILPAGFSQGGEAYAVTKINAEAKHRALSNFNIVDIRIFGFFGSLVDVDSPFLMSEIVKSIKDKHVFLTNKDDIIRDYIIAKDLLELVCLVMKEKKINDYFDIYSKKPISKFALLDALAKKYALIYVIFKPQTTSQKIIIKKSYYSRSKKATDMLGYKPTRTSLESILYELSRVFPDFKK